MILSTPTLQKIRELINERTVYRSGPNLVNFFNDLGSNDVYGNGFGVDIVFVAGCEYTIFSQGAFPGATFNERVEFMVTNGGAPMHGQHKTEAFMEASKKLNEILATICEGVRANFKGLVTYSSGTWEELDWNLFDIVGIDYYRRGESAEEYVGNLAQYKSKKPLLVMEVGSCAYEAAAEKGDGGFAILQGTNPDGTGIYAG